MTTDEQLIEAIMQSIHKADKFGLGVDDRHFKVAIIQYRAQAKAALAACRDTIRNEALEEAAKVALQIGGPDQGEMPSKKVIDVINAIRALKTSEKTEQEG